MLCLQPRNRAVADIIRFANVPHRLAGLAAFDRFRHLDAVAAVRLADQRLADAQAAEARERAAREKAEERVGAFIERAARAEAELALSRPLSVKPE